MIAGKGSEIVGSYVTAQQCSIIFLASFVQRNAHRHAFHFDELVSFQAENLLRLNIWTRQEDCVRKHFRGGDDAHRRNQRRDQNLAPGISPCSGLATVPRCQETTTDYTSLGEIVVQEKPHDVVEQPGASGHTVDEQRKLIVQVSQAARE